MKPSIPIVLIDLNETSRVSLKSVLNEIDGVAVHIEDKDFGKAFSLVRQVKPLIVILNQRKSFVGVFFIPIFKLRNM